MATKKTVKTEPTPDPDIKLPTPDALMIRAWGYRVGEHLAVTPSINVINTWNITHEQTGMIVNNIYELPSCRKAVVAIQEIDKLEIPWDKMEQDDSYNNNKLITPKQRAKLKAICKKYSE